MPDRGKGLTRLIPDRLPDSLRLHRVGYRDDDAVRVLARHDLRHVAVCAQPPRAGDATSVRSQDAGYAHREVAARRDLLGERAAASPPAPLMTTRS